MLVRSFLFIAVLVVIFIFVYYLIYLHRINVRISSGEIAGRKLIDIPKIIRIAVIVGLVSYSGLLVHMNNNSNNIEISRNNYAVIDVSDPDNYHYVSYLGGDALEDASFAGLFSKDTNAGYDKEIIKDNDFIFTVFKRMSGQDCFHPDFLCYAEYAGDNKKDLFLYNTVWFKSVNDEDNHFGLGSGGGEIPDSLLFIGYLDSDSYFEINFSILDGSKESAYDAAMEKAMEDDKVELPNVEDYALISAGTIIEF